MDKTTKYLAYLESLKTDKNSALIENIVEGFQTLVEYQVGGNITMRSTDVMTEDVEEPEEEGMVAIPKPHEEPEIPLDEVPNDNPLDESLEALAESLLEAGMTKDQIMDKIRHSKWVEETQSKGLGSQGKDAGKLAKLAMGLSNELKKSRGQEPDTEDAVLTECGEDDNLLEGVIVESFESYMESCTSDDTLLENIDVPLSDEQLSKIHNAVQAYKVKQNAEIDRQNLSTDINMIKAYLNKIGQDLWIKALEKSGIDNPSPELANAASKKATIVSG